MSQPFLGTEAISDGKLTRGKLRWNYGCLHPDVHFSKATVPDLFARTVAAWLWTGRTGIVTGRAAAALHGARWVDDAAPVEIITEHGKPQRGVIVREERIADDEICHVGDLPVANPPRTALDLGRHLTRGPAVMHLDALAAATGVTAVDALVVAHRYKGARHIRRARIALALMDAGAQSPKETWLRLLLIDAGLPRPKTQIPVSDGYNVAYIDMGWEAPKIGLDYEGDHHRQLRPTYVDDIGRYEMIERQGWIDLRVVAEHSSVFTLRRVRESFARRSIPPSSTSEL